MKRRSFIQKSSLAAFSVSAFGSIQFNGRSFVGDSPTTTDILGPFYRPGAPFRSNIIPVHSKGSVMNLSGTIFNQDGTSPLANALVEIWQCDEKEYYDNSSDEYFFRGALKSDANGKYSFRTIVPVPYKANPANENSWRPAHIHMRVSIPGQQDLVTQIYFKGDKYIEHDNWASNPEAVNRILTIGKNSAGENVVTFNVIMAKEFPLGPDQFEKITGLYRADDDLIEFVKKDDLLFVKLNGQYRASLKYIGDNTFEEKVERIKVKFELSANGATKASINFRGKVFSGEKFLKYKEVD